MAGYIDPASVAAEARVANSGFTDKTTPTLAKVTEIIGEVEAEVDLVIGRRFELPLLQNASLLFVRSICLALAAERVRNISPIPGGGNTDQNPFYAAAKNARARLAELAKGSFFLAGEGLPSGPVEVASFSCAKGYSPVFSRGVDQW